MRYLHIGRAFATPGLYAPVSYFQFLTANSGYIRWITGVFAPQPPGLLPQPHPIWSYPDQVPLSFIDRTSCNRCGFISYIGHFQLTPLWQQLFETLPLYRLWYLQTDYHSKHVLHLPTVPAFLSKTIPSPDCRSFLGNFFFEYQDWTVFDLIPYCSG